MNDSKNIITLGNGAYYHPDRISVINLFKLFSADKNLLINPVVALDKSVYLRKRFKILSEPLTDSFLYTLDKLFSCVLSHIHLSVDFLVGIRVKVSER